MLVPRRLYHLFTLKGHDTATGGRPPKQPSEARISQRKERPALFRCEEMISSSRQQPRKLSPLNLVLYADSTRYSTIREYQALFLTSSSAQPLLQSFLL